jgi:hypothetical protein
VTLLCLSLSLSLSQVLAQCIIQIYQSWVGGLTHNKELHALHSSLAIKWGKIKWAGLVARTVDLSQKAKGETTTQYVLSPVGGAVLSLCIHCSRVGVLEV